MEPPIFDVLRGFGAEFSRPEPWVQMGAGFLVGYALGRVAKALLPPLAFLYLAAFALGRANPERLVGELFAAGQWVWALLSGLPVGLSLGSVLGFLSGVREK